MEEEGEGGPRLSKRFSDKGGEVDYNTKAGTAWSHSFLNQKPWHPLSYPNQRRKWIAEQIHSNRERRAEEIAREFAQEQEFFRQTALVSQKEKEKMEMMKAVSFMYVRPPGYNAESAKAAELADEQRKEGGNQQQDVASTSMPLPSRDQSRDEKKKSVPKDVFGRALPTEEQFEVLKNAPRLETGAPARVKPFAVEVRNVKCLRCGNFGHQSGDRECPLKDAIMPSEESRLKRDDPLTAMLAHTDSSEPFKWELKQIPGMTPPRGGFDQNDPNQQIVAEDIFDEYGGFLGGEDVPELLASFTSSKTKKKSKSKICKRRKSPSGKKSRYCQDDGSCGGGDDDRRSKRGHHHTKKHHESSSSDDNEKIRKNMAFYNDDDGKRMGSRSRRRGNDIAKHRYTEPNYSSDDGEFVKYHGNKEHGRRRSRSRSRSKKGGDNKTKHRCSEPGYSSADDECAKHHGNDDDDKETRVRTKKRRYLEPHYSSGDGEFGKYLKNDEDSDDVRARSRSKKTGDNRTKHRDPKPRHLFNDGESDKHRKNEGDDERMESRSKKRGDNKTSYRHSERNFSLGDGEVVKHHRSRHKQSYSLDDSDSGTWRRSKHRHHSSHHEHRNS